MPKSYTTFDIVQSLNIKQERLREWIDRGYIKPSIQHAEGRGTKNLFSRDDLYLIGLFVYLLDSGFSREVAAEVTDGHTMLLDDLANSGRKNVYHDGGIVVPLIKDRTPGIIIPITTFTAGDTIDISFDELPPTCDGALVINMSKIRNKIDKAFGH